MSRLKKHKGKSMKFGEILSDGSRSSKRGLKLADAFNYSFV